MAVHTPDLGQNLCHVVAMTAEGTGTGAPNAECGSQSESQKCIDACRNSPQLSMDIEKGASDFPNKLDQETVGTIKTDIASTKLLRRQNSVQIGPESMPPLMNHILMLLKFDPKEKPAIERVHDAAHSKWRKYKRTASLDSRQIVLLFSILSSMGTILLIFLTLRVRQVSDGYIHG